MAIKLKGGKTNGMADMKKSLKKGVSGESFLQRVKADSTLTIRLLEEPDSWVKFYEYFDEEVNMFLPQAEGAKLTAKQKPVMRYIVNAIDIEEAKVIPLVLAKTVVQQLVKYYEKFATIKDRDYEITRSGTGLDTEYDVDRLDPVKMKLSQYELLDLEELLVSQLTIARSKRDEDESDDDEDDAKDDDDDDSPKSKPKSLKKSSMLSKSAKKKAVVEDDEDDDDDDDETPAPKKRGRPAKTETTSKKKVAVEVDEDEDDGDGNDGEEFDRDELENKSLAELKTIARGKEIDPKGLDKEELISQILGDSDDDADDSDDSDSGDDITEEDLEAMELPELRTLAKEYSIPTKGKDKEDLISALLAAGEDDDTDDDD